jgi:hypothetical protein
LRISGERWIIAGKNLFIYPAKFALTFEVTRSVEDGVILRQLKIPFSNNFLRGLDFCICRENESGGVDYDFAVARYDADGLARYLALNYAQASIN